MASMRRATAPEPQAVKQFMQEVQDEAQKDAFVKPHLAPIVLSNGSQLSHASPGGLMQSPRDLPASALLTPTPSHAQQQLKPAVFMTERQQLAFLMRATSEGDSGHTGRKKSAMPASASSDSDEDEAAVARATTKQGRRTTAMTDVAADSNTDGSSSASSSDEEEDSNSSSSSSDSSSEEESDRDDDHAPPQQQPQQMQQPQPQVVFTPVSSSRNVREKAAVMNDLLPRVIRRPREYALWPSEQQRRWDRVKQDPNAYYYNHLPPGIRPPTAGTGSAADSAAASSSPSATAAAAPWSAAEKALFLYALESHPPCGQWGLFSMQVPGRTGRTCEDFFKTLVREGLVSGGGVPTTTSAKKPSPNQPVKFSDKARAQYPCESTPFVVRLPEPGDGEHAAAGLSSEGVDVLYESEEQRLLRARARECAIAILSRRSMPGTEGLKDLPSAAPISAGNRGAKQPLSEKQTGNNNKRQRASSAAAAAAASDDDAAAAVSAAPASTGEAKENRAPGSSSAAARAAQRAGRAVPRSSTSAAQPATPTPSSSSRVGRSSRSSPGSASADGATSMDADSGAAMDDSGVLGARARAASDALMAVMSDLAAQSAAAASPAAATEASTAAAVVGVAGQKRSHKELSDDGADAQHHHQPSRALRRRAATDTGSGSGSGSGAGASSRNNKSSLQVPTRGGPLFVPHRHALPRTSLHTGEPGARSAVGPVLAAEATETVAAVASPIIAPAPATVLVPLLPFSSFSIPSHTPHSSRLAQAALARSDAALHVRRDAQPEPVARRLDFPVARFEHARAGLLEPMELDMDEHAQAAWDSQTGRIVINDAAKASKLAAVINSKDTTADAQPAMPAVSSAVSAADEDDDDDEVDLSLPRYSAELSRLETSLRTRQTKLASFQASQVARARLAFGLDPATGAAPGASGASAAGNGSPNAGRALPKPVSVSGLFNQPAHAFDNGCRRLLAEYFSVDRPSSASSAAGAAATRALPSHSSALLARCRTYAEALSEIGAAHRAATKEVMREHNTARDVLMSLKKAGLMR